MSSVSAPARGVFITLEGIDGTGKSTQAALLAKWLTAQGWSVVHTREPGGTPLGVELRQLLLGLQGGRQRNAGAQVRADVESTPVSGGVDDRSQRTAPVPVAEMLLMAADRAQHVEHVIRPALDAGRIVVCERYVDSSIAYQAGGLGLPESHVRRVNDVATAGLRPNLTILLDLDPERAYGRDGRSLDRIERRGLEFQQRVRATYHNLARREPDRWVLVSVDGLSVDDVQAAITLAVQVRLARRVADEERKFAAERGSDNIPGATL